MTSNASAVSVRLAPSAAGQTAHDLRLGPQPEYVDASRSSLNRILIKPLTNEALRDGWEAVKQATGKKGKLRSNQNLSYAGIITFGTEAQKIFERLIPDQQDAALRDVADKMAERFGTKLTGLVVHLDETALHAHFQLRGIGDNGTVLSSLVKRGALRDVQTLAAEVMGRHAPGIERGTAKQTRLDRGEDYAATLNRSVKQLHEDLPFEIAAKQAELADLIEKARKNEALAKKARAKAEADESRAFSALKNAETYERRANTAREEIGLIEASLVRLGERQNGILAENQKLAESGNRIAQANGVLAEAQKQAVERLEATQRQQEVIQAALGPLRAAFEAVEAHSTAEALRIAAIRAEDIRRQAENEVAAQLTDPHWMDQTATAILIAQKQPDWNNHWDFGPLVQNAGLKADKGNFAQVLAEFKTAPKTFDYIREAVDDEADVRWDYGTIKEALSKFGEALQRVGGQVQTLRDNPVRWMRLFDGLGVMVKQVFERAADSLTDTLLREASKPSPPPSEAKPLLDLPEPVQEKLRQAFSPAPPKGPSPF